MGIVAALMVGMIAGALLALLASRDEARGLVIAMALGVAGALAAVWIGDALGWYSGDGEGHGIIGAGVGAAAVLVTYRLAGGRR